MKTQLHNPSVFSSLSRKGGWKLLPDTIRYGRDTFDWTVSLFTGENKHARDNGNGFRISPEAQTELKSFFGITI